MLVNILQAKYVGEAESCQGQLWWWIMQQSLAIPVTFCQSSETNRKCSLPSQIFFSLAQELMSVEFLIVYRRGGAWGWPLSSCRGARLFCVVSEEAYVAYMAVVSGAVVDQSVQTVPSRFASTCLAQLCKLLVPLLLEQDKNIFLAARNAEHLPLSHPMILTI